MTNRWSISGLWAAPDGAPATTVKIPNPWQPTSAIKLENDVDVGLEFGKRSGLAALGRKTNDLAQALADPAQQLINFNKALQDVSNELGMSYRDIVNKLRDMAYPNAVIEEMADEFIRPQLHISLGLLKQKYPYAMSQGNLNPLSSIASGIGTGASFAASSQFKNFEALKGGIGKRRHKHKKYKKYYRAHKRSKKHASS